MASLLNSAGSVEITRVFYVDEIRELENSLGPTDFLIDRAAAVLAAEVRKLAPSPCRLLGLIGKGNNARDCLQTFLRLGIHGYRYGLVVLDETRAVNLPEWRRAATNADFIVSMDENSLERLNDYKPQATLDGIFGIGYKPPLPEKVKRVLRAINSMNTSRIAIDIPTGAVADTAAADSDSFKADVTVTFFGLKPAHILYPARKVCGKVKVRTLGFLQEVEGYKTHKHYLYFRHLPRLPLSREPDVHKKTASVMLIAGSRLMPGAAYLAGEAAFAAGAGYVGLFSESEVAQVIAGLLPEAVSFLRSETTKAMDNFHACVMGPGLGRDEKTINYVLSLAENLKIPTVLDGDALYALAKCREKIDLKQQAVLTPHIGEARRLLDRFDEIPPTEASAAIARKFNAICILKTPLMVVSDGKETVVVRQGSNNLATAGTGDLLSGITGALMAQQMPPFEAAVYGAIALSTASLLCEQQNAAAPIKSSELVKYIRMVFEGMCGESHEG